MKSKNIYLNLAILTGVFILLLLVNSCTNDVTPSLYSDQPPGETPVINSVDPPDKALAGISNITITGENFSTTADNNLVFFNAAPAEILSASATQLVVKAPNIVGEGINLKIAVHKVELFSNTVSYTLESALSDLAPSTDLIPQLEAQLTQFQTELRVATDIRDQFRRQIESSTISQALVEDRSAALHRVLYLGRPGQRQALPRRVPRTPIALPLPGRGRRCGSRDARGHASRRAGDGRMSLAVP